LSVCQKTLPVTGADTPQPGYRVLWIEDHELAARCVPGMFFELKADRRDQANRLYKPISVYQVREGRMAFMVKEVGEGSKALCSLQPGDGVRLIGPLGNAFPLLNVQNILLVSGGVGYPPLSFLKSCLPPSSRVIHLHGGASAKDIFPCDIVCTEDGSAGSKGRVTDLVPSVIAENRIQLVYSCGPQPMLKALARMVEGIPHFVSLEAYMACGIGVCYGCSVPVGNEFKRVCKDGPVFNAADIDWEKL
jgi:dihydroorotate dehydrogenase electron transfer subunit